MSVKNRPNLQTAAITSLNFGANQLWHKVLQREKLHLIAQGFILPKNQI